MNCAIYQKGSDEIRYFVRDCVKLDNDFLGSNKKLYGVKPAIFDFLWTDDDVDAVGSKRVSELTPIAQGIEIAKPTRKELHEAVRLRGQIANMSYSQVENYIDNNVTDLASAKTFLKTLSRVVLAVIKIQDKE